MKIKFISKRIKRLSPVGAITIITISFLSLSCTETVNSSQIAESELILKINAVQQQVMVQGNISEDEEKALLSLCSIVTKNDGLANYSPENRMILKDVNIAPVYNGCEKRSQEETKECFNTSVAAFIKREFDIKVSQKLNLLEPKQVAAFFIIDENGNLTGMKVRDSEVTIQGEILRVLRKMPVMKPAIHNEKSVAVLCSVLVKYGNTIEINPVFIPERPEN